MAQNVIRPAAGKRDPKPNNSARATAAQTTIAFKQISKDPRAYKIAGGFLVALSVCLLLAFVSYLVSGTEDQSAVQAMFAERKDLDGIKVKNTLGLFGLVVSHYFIFYWFGIAALALPILLFLFGTKIAFGWEPILLKRTTQKTLFYVFWVSLFLGFVVLNTGTVRSLGLLCGGIGYEINALLDQYIGWGSLFLILGALLAFMMFFHGIHSLDQLFDRLPKRKVTPPDLEVVAEEEDDEDDTDEEDDNHTMPPVVKPVVSKDNAKQVKLEVTPVPKTEPIGKPEGLKLVVETPDAEELVEEFTAPLVSSHSSPPAPIVPFADTDKITDDLLAEFGPYDPTLELAKYQYPTLELLHTRGDGNAGRVTTDELEDNKNRIVETLGHFGIGIASIKATIGPTVTLYEIVPEAGVRISKIKGLEDDIALNLAALGIRIIAPMPGKGTIGIELPNKNREMVSMRSVLASKKFQDTTFDLPIIMGKTISNEIFISDLAKMPHLLMAGATGQGKSVGLNVLLASLLYKKHPATIKFVLVDPKKVELTLFNKIERHFLAKLPNSEEAIITDTKKVVYTLNSLCIEMDTRYDLLKNAGVRNIKEYNAKFTNRQLNPEQGHHFLPYIVLIIDELADLMMTAGKEVEQPIARLAQLARAIGIHLVVATQRPSVNVITGLIKANFPARLSFRVTSKIDSRTILDTGGAEQLVGMGDMLLSMGSDMIRLQCPFVDTDEIDDVCEFIGNQRGYASAYHLPEFSGDDDADERGEIDLADRDPMFDDAARVVVNSQQGSTSLIQRKLKLGYNRAGRIMDQLEAAGIVGGFEGSKAREVLITDLNSLEQILKNLK
jgi:DNA segregation ATPase FtsK/SpoIIIE, S-DNA-T family